MHIRSTATVLVTCVGLAGCVLDEGDASTYDTALGTAPSVGLLAFVNDQDHTDVDLLDVDCAIRSDSAKHIIRHRDGNDKQPFTSDDDLFDSVEELDGAKMVGPWTIDRLTTCAWLFGYMRGVGPTLAGEGTAAIDGVLGAGEWDGADAHPVDVELPEGGSVSATLYVMNDAATLYMALVLDDDLLDRYLRATVLFDDDGDGFVEADEDRIAAVYRPSSGATSFGDAHVGAPAERASDFIASFYYDTSRGGTSEGSAATGATGGATVLELAHPLASGDAFDLDAGAGSVVPFAFAVAVLADEWVETRDWANIAVTAAATEETVPWDLPPHVLAELAAVAEGYADPNVAFPMELAEQTATLVDGTPVSYRVRFVQMIDPEGGIQLWVDIELDASFAIVSENAYI